MLKLQHIKNAVSPYTQPPSGGCVLKPSWTNNGVNRTNQPPSGGCVLKPGRSCRTVGHIRPAAFRRLCVETLLGDFMSSVVEPAAFRRLCVETVHQQPPSTRGNPAAFRRLCVETAIPSQGCRTMPQPPSGGCVLKQRRQVGGNIRRFQPPSGGCVLKPCF